MALDNKNKHNEDKERYRRGRYGHLRTGPRPESIERLKKKRMTKSMIIGMSSLLMALLLACGVFLIVQPNGTASNSEVATSGQSAQSSTSGSQDSNQSASSDSNQTSDGSNSSKSKEPNVKDNKVNTNQLPDSSFLYDTDIAELIKADSFNDGQTVQVKGEVVGDAIDDESNASLRWISLQDDNEVNPGTISVLVDETQLGVVDSFGQYKQKGSTVQVQGTYHLTCADHQGLSDIHATEVQLLSEGKQLEMPVNPVIITAAVISVFLGVALLIFYVVRRERMR